MKSSFQNPLLSRFCMLFVPSVALFALLPACIAVGAATNTPARFTLDDCIRTGLKRSAVATNARRDKEIARATVSQARSQVLPQLTADGGYTRLDEIQSMDIGGQMVEMGTLDNYSVDFRLNQLLYSGGKMHAAIKAARLAHVYADLELANVEEGLVRDIRIGFYDILLAKSMVAVKEES
ncbi:MAG: TolC family protein, partial [bacterium]